MNSKRARPTDGPTKTPRIPADPDSDVMLAASSGESNGNSEYAMSPENLPTSSANMPELEGRTQELQQMHNVAEEDIDTLARPTELFTHPDKLDPTELAADGTTLAKNHRNNGALPPYGTQQSLPYSPLSDASVAMDEPPSQPRVEDSASACLSSVEDLLKVCLKENDGIIWGLPGLGAPKPWKSSGWRNQRVW